MGVQGPVVTRMPVVTVAAGDGTGSEKSVR
jgi:hypothetical protein